MNIEAEFVQRLINKPDYAFKTAIMPDDLEDDGWRAAFGAVKKLIAGGVTPDFTTVVMECPEYAVQIMSLDTLVKANFEFVEEKLVKQVERKRLTIAANSFIEYLSTVDNNMDIVAKVEELIAASRVEHDHREVKSLYDCAIEFGAVLEARYYAKGLVGIPSGFDKLDKLTGGFQPGVYYVGARPSQGKTALMLSMMRAALKSGSGAGLISVESSEMDLIARVLSAEGPIMMNNLKSGRIVPSEFSRLKDSIERIKGFNGQIYFNTKADLGTIESIARRMVKTNGVGILFVDYLQRIYSPGKNKIEQVGNSSRAMTDIAKGLGIPVVCLAQTGRQADTEAPSMSHFQHSSAIEQDADIAMIINNYKDDRDIEQSQLCVLKNRDGEIDNVAVHFDREHVRFTEKVSG